MDVCVLMKAVPASTEVSMDPVTHTIVRDGGDAVWNPFDTAALELALRLKDGCGATVTVLSMGIPATAALLRDALARGADRCMLLSDRAFAGSDTLATSYALTLGLRALGGFDLVLSGKMAVDGDTAQIGPEVAEALGVPCVSAVGSLSVGDGAATCTAVSDGVRRTVRVPLPCVLTVEKAAADLRMPSVEGVLAAEGEPMPVMGAAEAGADPARCGLDGPPTQVPSFTVPETSTSCVVVEGGPAEAAARLCDLVAPVLEGAAS